MNILLPILQMLGVAAGSFAVFALLVSYLRYRKLQLISLDQVEGVMDPSAAVMVMLTALQEDKNKAERSMLLFAPGPDTDPVALRDYLRENLRREDRLFLLRERRVLAFLQCPEEHLAATARRILPLLTAADFPQGGLFLSLVDRDPAALMAAVQGNMDSSASEGWTVYPQVWRKRTEFNAPENRIENSQPGIPESVSVDPLTGVLKADRVPRAVRRLLASHRRAGRSLTFVRVDLDELETYNVSYGRETGDRILSRAASILMANCRENDLIGRLEEDAFIICMAGKDKHLLQAANRMSEQIKNSPLIDGKLQVRFSAAFGLASMPNDGKNPVVLMERAELALQEAKRRGRGMCVAFQPSLQPKAHPSATNENRPESF